ncbi:MAG TPA: Sec-independent protein translocase protein TatB [Stellaceae bacterium]|nr:Sec-independent protein translocase protein TatB [Stellaceae bacterium]
MLFDIGWAEMLLIGVVALVVIGPKDLPRAMRTAGLWMRKARTLSREFHSSIDQMIREAELEEVQRELKKATEFDVAKELQNTVDPTGSLSESIKPLDVPDYLDPAPGPGELAAAEALPEISPPAETVRPGPGAPAGGMPQPGLLPVGAVNPFPANPEPMGSSIAAPKPAPEPEPAPKPRQP